MLFADCLVSLGVEKILEFFGVVNFHLDNPVAESIFVDELWIIGKLLVNFNHCSGYRRDKVACCLYTFNSAEFFALSYFVVNVGHINVNYVAKLMLCIVGDAYICIFSFDSYKFVRLRIVESFNYFTHGFYRFLFVV